LDEHTTPLAGSRGDQDGFVFGHTESCSASDE
jgi:hypothetical protein